MKRLADYLIEARVGALEQWRNEHAQAMASHDIDESLGEVVRLWREIIDLVDEAPLGRRRQHIEWLAQHGIITRLLTMAEHLREIAASIGYFERGFRFSTESIEGLIAGLRLAVEAGAPPERMQLELDLANLPPRITTAD